ncbi:MAG TPA: hypothetical protein PLO33_20470 [Kouleothrix sp.]|uniref:hypothetical protein n=1 Tax=Kouleothrix sp. TaxID=2779161 RepID=UPI002B8DFA5A|nr:hypothetical protein [Kouleothrix sp.]
MLRERSIEIALAERKQRRALFIFAIAAVIMLGFCAWASLRMVTPPSKLLPAGQLSDYADGKTHRFSVPKTNVSSLITRRDVTLSEDTLFVRQAPDGSWVALLGVDTLSGCFLYWDEPAGVYQDVNCQGARYSADGRYLDGLKGGEQPQNMARMPVEVRGGQVFVRDELLHER